MSTESPLTIIDSRRRPIQAEAFTLIELLVTVGIILVLASILFPVAGSMIKSAQANVCAANLRQLVAAGRLYIQDHDGMFPTTYLYNMSTHGKPGVQDYLTQDNRSKIYKCPTLARDDRMTPATLKDTGGNTYTVSLTASSNTAHTDPNNVQIGTNPDSLGSSLDVISRVQLPSRCAWIMDGAWNGSTQFNSVIGRNQLQNLSRLEYPHSDCEHVVFVDGHMESIKRDGIPTDPYDPFWSGRNR